MVRRMEVSVYRWDEASTALALEAGNAKSKS